MPIQAQQPIKALSEQEFHELDYTVMAMAFKAHNSLGRFFNETIYKNTLLQKCMEHNLTISRELEIRLSHKDYSKSVFIDLLIENTVYERKPIKELQEAHRIQTLNYLFASNTQFGKLLNLRPSSVEHEFVSTTLDVNARKRVHFRSNGWKGHSKAAEWLKTVIEELVLDWGAFFDSSIYEEAVIHLLGGKDRINIPTAVAVGGKGVGHQKTNALSESERYIITTYRKHLKQAAAHLLRFLSHTPFQTMYWINFNHREIQFQTLEN